MAKKKKVKKRRHIDREGKVHKPDLSINGWRIEVGPPSEPAPKPPKIKRPKKAAQRATRVKPPPRRKAKK